VIYPENFEIKIGMAKIREIVSGFCLFEPGRNEIYNLEFSSDPVFVESRLNEVWEFCRIIRSDAEFPIENFIDISPALAKARIEGRFLEEFELVNLKKALDAVRAIVQFLKRDEKNTYPALKNMAADVKVFPVVQDRLNQLISKQGTIRDNASPTLSEIRNELRRKEGAISKLLGRILEKARKDGIVEEDAALSVRNGRSVIPVAAGLKRRLSGYVHDESATGKTVYIEPAEVVEANNELRDLENREKREIVKILIEFTDFIRPYIDELRISHLFLAKIDSIRARARFSINIAANLPGISNNPELEWNQAIHPLLFISFRSGGREKDIIPLDIKLDRKSRMLVISGPNAGGKSVCLQTVGLLQYMFQSGFLVPAEESSVFGIFDSIFLDMGDEQSIEDDLSTYSSHLLNMKAFLKNSNEKSLILIDEFGSGTEPSLGAAIAESVLESLNIAGVFGVITTHYTNLKHFAASTEGMINGAMLFDIQHIRPLYKLSIGKPGSSFAFEIARKIGLPGDILKTAEDKVGQEHVDFDKHLKDIIRDKKYWENKRQKIRINEKRLDELVQRYDSELGDSDKLRKKIINEARIQAENLLADANRKIENTIREIKEAEAEKEKTKKIRNEFNSFRERLSQNDEKEDIREETEHLKQKIEELRRRSERIRKRSKSQEKQKTKEKPDTSIRKGDKVLLKGQDVPGEVIHLKGEKAEVVFGTIKTRVSTDTLTKIPDDEFQRNYKPKSRKPELSDWSIGTRKLHFSPDIDVRGKRADEALGIITEFIDEAIMVQSQNLRILHGKGNGILRELIRQHLSALDVVEWYGDEHAERGGAGITLVKLSS
jgi:DNA mismatch repair protein MutS2